MSLLDHRTCLKLPVGSDGLLISEIKTESGWDELLQESQELHTEINSTIKENKDLVQKSFRGVQEEVDDVRQELSKNIDEAKKEALL